MLCVLGSPKSNQPALLLIMKHSVWAWASVYSLRWCRPWSILLVKEISKVIEKAVRWTGSPKSVSTYFSSLCRVGLGMSGRSKAGEPPASFYLCIDRKQLQHHVSAYSRIWHATYLAASHLQNLISCVQPRFKFAGFTRCFLRPGFPHPLIFPRMGPVGDHPLESFWWAKRFFVAEDTGSSKTHPVFAPQHPPP